jgi:hypothetical protein
LLWSKMTSQIASSIGMSYGGLISLLYSMQCMVRDSRALARSLVAQITAIGQDMRESRSPSYFNPHEIDLVDKYLDMLLGDPALAASQSLFVSHRSYHVFNIRVRPGRYRHNLTVQCSEQEAP